MEKPKRPWLPDVDEHESDGDEFFFDSRPVWELLDPADGLPAWEALFHFIDRDKAVELYGLDLAGYGDLSNRDPSWWPEERKEFDTQTLRHRLRFIDLNSALWGKLRRGELVAYGFSNQSPLDAPRRRIASERWQDLEIDAKASTASGPSIEVTQLRIYQKGADTRPKATPARKNHSPAALRKWYVERLTVCAKSGRIPSRVEDYNDANAQFGGSIPKRAVEDLRRELAPQSWTRKGRRSSR